MKLKKAKLENFGSFETLEFDFENQDLTLIHGPTGSGKSTILDAPTWILFGRTAKDGSVDDVLSWTGSGVTKGTLSVETPNGIIEVTRIRGAANQNDCYFLDTNSKLCRGSNIKDTQSLIIKYLGLTYEQFTLSSYFNEFSGAGSFFIANSKARRSLLEQIADLSLPTSLEQKVVLERKEVKKQLLLSERTVLTQSARIKQLQDLHQIAFKKSQTFDQDKAARIEKLTQESTKNQESRETTIQTLEKDIKTYKDEIDQYKTETCPTCGRTDHAPKLIELQLGLNRRRSELQTVLYYIDPNLRLLKSINNEVNQYTEQAEAMMVETNKILVDLVKEQDTHQSFKRQEVLLEQLDELLSIFKLELLQKSVKQLQELTNEYLTDYFDAEMQIEFTLPDGESLDVQITKSGYEAVYRQLSKGQKQLLKLSFALAVMKVSANTNSKHFDTIMLDEPLDGVDTTLKLKAYRLFEKLSKSHSTVLVIDHSEELKNCFDKHYEIALLGDISHIL